MSNTISPEYDHVAIFKDHVSWVVGYEYIGQIGDGYHYKIHTDSHSSIDAVFCRAEFCCADNFWDVIEKIPEGHGELEAKMSLWIIIEDYMPEVEIDRFVYAGKRALIPFFMNVKSSVHYNNLTWLLLDKMIQEKLNQICAGVNN